MRQPLFHGARSARALSIVAATVALAACGGGSSGTNPVPNTNGACSFEAQAGNIQLAFPVTNSQVSSGSVNRLEVVAAGNNLQFSTTFNNYMLVAVPQFNQSAFAQTGSLGTTADPNGYHPYPTPSPGDFYYGASITQGSIQSNQLYNVYLNIQSNACQPSLVGSFQT